MSPDQAAQIAELRDGAKQTASAAEAAEWLARHRRGDAVFASAQVAALVASEAGVDALDGCVIGGLWFDRGDHLGNLQHAREVIVDRLDELRDALSRRHGVALTDDDLVDPAIDVVPDDDVAAWLEG